MFNYIWNNKYIFYDIVKYNHDNSSRSPAITGYFNALKYNTWLIDREQVACNYACIFGHLAIAKWLWQNGLYDVENDHDKPINKAVMYSQLHIIEWFYENTDAKIYKGSVNFLASIGRLNTLKWLWEKYNIKCTNTGIKQAIISDHTQTVKWILSTYGKDGIKYHDLFIISVEKNNYNLVKYLCNEYYINVVSQKLALEWAVLYNFIDIAKLLYKNLEIHLNDNDIKGLIKLAQVYKSYNIQDWLQSNTF